MTVDLDTGTFVKFFLVFTGFVLAGYFITKITGPLSLLFISFFLAIALNPPVTRLANMLPGHSRVGATALSYVIVIGLLGGLLVLAIPPAVEQAIRFFQQVPTYLEQVQGRQGPVENFLAQYGLQGQLDTAIENAKEQASNIAQQVGSSFVNLVGNAFSGFVSVITVLVLTFLMLIEGPAWMRRIWGLYSNPERRDRHRKLIRDMYRTVTAYVIGQVLVAAIAALMTLAVLLLLGTFLDVPLGVAFPLAGAVFLFSMIPMIGATIGGVIVTLVLLFNDTTAAIIFAIYFIIYQQIENNFIQPVVQSRSVGLSALAVLTAVLIGISLAGILGGLVAIPIAACIRVALLNYLEDRKAEADRQPENIASKVKAAITRALPRKDDAEDTEEVRDN